LSSCITSGHPLHCPFCSGSSTRVRSVLCITDFVLREFCLVQPRFPCRSDPAPTTRVRNFFDSCTFASSKRQPAFLGSVLVGNQLCRRHQLTSLFLVPITTHSLDGYCETPIDQPSRPRLRLRDSDRSRSSPEKQLIRPQRQE
jgi:hypothetical protein